MDVKKLNVPTLEGPNWGEYAPKIQAAFRIFDCWDIVKGEILTPPPNPTYDLLAKPTAPPANVSAQTMQFTRQQKPSGTRRTLRPLASCKHQCLLSSGKTTPYMA